jgi:hypothetical protein
MRPSWRGYPAKRPRHFSYRDAGSPAQIGQRKAGIDFGAIKPRG